MRRLNLWLIIIPIVGVAIFYFTRIHSSNAPQFLTAKIDRGAIVETVSATGTINPIVLVNVGTQVSGTIAKWYFDFDDVVKKNDILCELDKRPYKARVDQDTANVAQSQANVYAVAANLKFAGLELERSKRLLKEKLISQEQLDQQQANYDALAANLEVSKAQVEQNKAQLFYDNTNLEYATIHSPVDGVVVARNIDIGQTVAASFQTPTLYQIAEDMTKIYALADVSEADIGHIRLNQKTTFTVDAYPNDTFTGAVEQIRINSQSISNVVMYTVVVDASNPEKKLLPGMTANLLFDVKQTPKDTLRVPNMALRFEPEQEWISETARRPLAAAKGSRGKQHLLWIVENNKLKPIPVTTGITDGEYTQIKNGEVEEGQEVAVGIKLNNAAEGTVNPLQPNIHPQTKKQ